MSRHHCQIITGAKSCVIEDLNSTNGIYVQGKRVRRHNLNDGDVVVIGKHELMYVDERLARTRSSLTETVPGVPVLQRAAAAVHREEEDETEVGLEETRAE